MTTTLQVSYQDTITRIELASADGRNRIDADLLAALAGAVAEIDTGKTRALVLASSGADFSLGWTAEYLAGAASQRGRPLDPFGVLTALAIPVIAEVGGQAVSAGLELALACDIRIAAADAQFSFPELERGYIPLAGGTQRLPRLVGHGHATEMILLGRVVDAATAYHWGLLNLVVPRSELTGSVQRYAELVAARGPIAERFAKEALRDGLEMPLARALRYELDLTVLLQTTDDRAEGVRAFVEKRSPEFKGR